MKAVLSFIWKYLCIVVKAIGKFLKFTYASQITIAVLAIIINLSGHRFWGIFLFAWAILLFINELKQNKTNG